MKTRRNLILFTSACCLGLLVLTCNRQKAPKTVTVPFTADALGEYKYIGPDTLPNPKCTDSLSVWRAIVDCKGNGTPLGKFTAHFDFCGDAESHYGNTYAYLVAENGDTVFINASGQVLDGRLDEHPEFVTSYWKDTIIVIGGTGKYHGAKGIIIGDDYNSSEDDNSHHRWTGTLTLIEEKK
jgi:hypothetical protein